MTGRQPEVDRVDEEGVVDTAVALSAFPDVEETRANAIEQIKKLGLSPDLTDDLIDVVQCAEADYVDANVTAFRCVLDEIPKENDSVDNINGGCSVPDFRNRSKLVAAKLREAAKLLPT